MNATVPDPEAVETSESKLLEKGVVIVEGPLTPLVTLLINDKVIQQAIDQILPFSNSSPSWKAAVDAAAEEVGAVAEGSLRLSGYPAKTVVPALLEAVPSGLLSPSKFTHVLSCLEWKELGRNKSEQDLLWSLLPRELLDPRAWRKAAEAPPFEGFLNLSSKKRADAKAVAVHLSECAARHSPGLNVRDCNVLVVADRAEKLTAVEGWCRAAGLGRWLAVGGRLLLVWCCMHAGL